MSSKKSKKSAASIAAAEHAAELTAVHKPSKEFSKKARIGSMAEYEKLYKQSIEKPEKFWASEAKELVWQKPGSIRRRDDVAIRGSRRSPPRRSTSQG